MTLTPDMAVSPVSSAPPDRPSIDLETSARQFVALALRDGGIDENEMQIVRWVVESIASKIQEQGGVLPVSGQQTPQSTGNLTPSPQEMNTQTQDWGTSSDATPVEEYGT